MSQKIRIKLKSYDHNLVDKSAEKIVRTVKATGAIVAVQYLCLRTKFNFYFHTTWQFQLHQSIYCLSC